MSLSDYIRVSKVDDPAKHAARWHINVKTGEMISRWQHQILQNGGKINPRQMAVKRKAVGVVTTSALTAKKYGKFETPFKHREAERLGVSPSKIKVRGSSESALKYKSIMRTFRKLTKEDWSDLSAKGRVAKVFIELGLRDPEWDLPRGQSPTT